MPATLGEPQFVKIDTAAGDTTLVAAQAAGVKIRVLDFFIVAGAAAACRFESGAGGTQLTGLMTLNSGSPIFSNSPPFGNFETAAATLLNLHQSGVVQLSGFLIWCTAQ